MAAEAAEFNSYNEQAVSAAKQSVHKAGRVVKMFAFFIRHPGLCGTILLGAMASVIPAMLLTLALTYIAPYRTPAARALTGVYTTDYLEERGVDARNYPILYECGERDNAAAYYDYFHDGRAGAYNLHYAYGLSNFLSVCVGENADLYSDFIPYQNAGEATLRSDELLGEAWHSVFRKNAESFMNIQDYYVWDAPADVNGGSFQTVVDYQARRGFHIERCDAVVQGLIFSWHNRAGVENNALSFLASAGITDEMSDEEIINALCDEIATRDMYNISGLSGHMGEIRERYCTGGPTVGGPGVSEREFCLSILHGTGTYGRGKTSAGGSAAPSDVNWSAQDHTLEEFLAALQEVSDEGFRYQWHWGDSSATNNPGDDGVTSCDAIIDRALIKIGFTYRPEGHRMHVMDYPDVLPACGFTKIVDPNNRMPGDIVIFKSNDPNVADHSFAIKNVYDNGKIDKFDFGSNTRIWRIQSNDNVDFDEWAGRRTYYCTLRGNWGTGQEYVCADGSGVRLTGPGARIAYEASKYVGKIPYVWGGSSLETGVDCSHLVWLVLKNCGAYNGPYLMAKQWVGAGTEVEGGIDSAQAGDIIVWDGHVAIADGSGGLIEARNEDLGLTHGRKASEVNKPFLGVRRFAASSGVQVQTRGQTGYIRSNNHFIIELVKLFFGPRFGTGSSGSISLGGYSEMGTDGAAASLEAEVKFDTQGTIAGAKVGLHGFNRRTGEQSAYALDVLYGGDNVVSHDKCYLHSEGIWEKASLPGEEGKDYKDIGVEQDHEDDYTDWVRLRVAWWEDGTVRSYVNDKLMFEGTSDFEPTLFAIEATAFGSGHQVMAEFRNVRACCDFNGHKGVSGTWQASGAFGLIAQQTAEGSIVDSGAFDTHGQPTYGVSARLGGYVGDTMGLNWDQTMHYNLRPISCYLSIGMG